MSSSRYTKVKKNKHIKTQKNGSRILKNRIISLKYANGNDFIKTTKKNVNLHRNSLTEALSFKLSLTKLQSVTAKDNNINNNNTVCTGF